MQGPAPEQLTCWSDVVKAFDSFPPPKLDFDPEREIERTSWIFRGHRCSSYALEPSVERVAKQKTASWDAVESLALAEFQSKARMYMDVSELPPRGKLNWLAAMQHYGIPTRLLDFTYSPYVATYFAVRDNSNKSPSAVWAIDANAVLQAAIKASRDADREANAKQSPMHRVPLDLRSLASDLDNLRNEGKFWKSAIKKALKPDGLRRYYFNKNGFIAFALPPAQNRRLSSQQGAFLFNAADDLTFEQSLFKMMARKQNWCSLFEISPRARVDIERRLFQANIHDLSLFPDIEGLSRFIRQKARLHWAPSDRSGNDQAEKNSAS